jgi:arylsulfatase B
VWTLAAALAAEPAPAPAEPAPLGEPWTAPPAPAAPASPPNVLLIVADDMGTDKVASYAEHPRTPATPVLDDLARGGVRFRNAYSYPLCSPTRAAILTGRLGRRNGLGVIIPWNGTWELPLDEVTIPELLDRSGTDWATAAIGKWHLSGPRTANGYRHANLQGFDHVAGSINNLYFDDEISDEKGDTNYFSWEKNVDGLVTPVTQYATAATTDDALTWVTAAREPWFLYVAYNSAHAPFHVPPGSTVSSSAPAPARHAAMVEDLDREIGRLLGGLPAGQRERTLIVFVADNGTPHGVVLPPRKPSQGKGSLYEGGTNVPLIVAGPGVFRGGVTDALVHVVDLLPTIAECTGVDPTRTGAPLDGVSFAAALRSPADPGRRRFVVTEKFGPAGRPPYRTDQRAVRDERYKLLVTEDDGEWFFDLLGRDDDGPGRRPEALGPEERLRYEALKAELARVEHDARFAY